MWGKIASVAKKIAVGKAVDSAAEKTNGNLFSIKLMPIFIGIIVAGAVLLLIAAPFFILSSHSTTLILQALDPNKTAEEEDANECGPHENSETICANQNGVTKILFVGNSRTYRPGNAGNNNGIPARLANIAKEAGYEVEITNALQGAQSLGNLSSIFDDKINQSYDCVVMQEQTETYLYNYNAFLSGAQSIVDKVKNKNSNVKTYVRNTWAYNTFNKKDLQSGYNNGNKVAEETGSFIIEDGKAFETVHTNNPEINLMSDDRHQSNEGAYLSAATIFKTLFGKSVDGNNYKDGLSQDQASILQKAADDTVSTKDNTLCGGPILLIAGHSYEPYCNQVQNECRYPAASGYFEPDETRSLVKLIKSELINLGIETDVANELLAPGDSKMNSSLFVEGTLNSDKFKEINWSKYKYVLEVHFNAAGNGELQTSKSGPLLVKNDANYSTPIDKDIISAITTNLGTSQDRDSIQFNDSKYHNFNFFKDQNIPITYLETEYFDNKEAMDKYSSNKGKIAKDIAKAIKSAYGNSGSASSVVECAQKQVGKPYIWGAEGPDSFDCSGLVMYCYKEGLGVDLDAPRSTTITLLVDSHFTEVSSLDELTPGDIIVNNQHVIIKKDSTTAIEAMGSAWGVVESNLQQRAIGKFLHYNGKK